MDAPNPDSSGLVFRLADNTRIKIIGLGGVGCIVLQFLAMLLNSLGQQVRLVLIDGDEFEPANSQRMAFHNLGNKAEVKAAETVGLLDSGTVAVVAVPKYVSEDNVGELIGEGDLILLCCDNHPTRKLVSDHCQRLSDVVLISGGNEAVNPPEELGTYGNVQIAIRQGGKDVTVPITRFHPEIAHPQGRIPTEMDCGQQAVSAPQFLITNMFVAAAMLGSFVADACDRLSYQEIKFDVLEARMLPQLSLTGNGVSLSDSPFA